MQLRGLPAGNRTRVLYTITHFHFKFHLLSEGLKLYKKRIVLSDDFLAFAQNIRYPLRESVISTPTS